MKERMSEDDRGGEGRDEGGGFGLGQISIMSHDTLRTTQLVQTGPNRQLVPPRILTSSSQQRPPPARLRPSPRRY